MNKRLQLTLTIMIGMTFYMSSFADKKDMSIKNELESIDGIYFADMSNGEKGIPPDIFTFSKTGEFRSFYIKGKYQLRPNNSILLEVPGEMSMSGIYTMEGENIVIQATMQGEQIKHKYIPLTSVSPSFEDLQGKWNFNMRSWKEKDGSNRGSMIGSPIWISGNQLKFGHEDPGQYELEYGEKKNYFIASKSGWPQLELYSYLDTITLIQKDMKGTILMTTTFTK